MALELTETNYTGEDFVEVDLSDQSLRNVEFSDCDFSGAVLAGSVTTRTTFTRCRFVGTEMWATLAGALIDVDQAVLFAAAHGLVLARPVGD